MRTQHTEKPRTLFDVLGNIIHDLEHRQPDSFMRSSDRDLIIQAFIALKAAIEVEHDTRKAAE